MKTIALTLAAFGLLSLSARAEDKTSKLVGKWEMIKGEAVGLTAAFTKDGKVKVVHKRGDKTETHEGTYKLAGDMLKVMATEGGKEHTETFKVKTLTDKEMVLVDKRDKEATFKKVK